jgi:hypothetical protein
MTEKLTKRIIDCLVAEADPGRDTLVWNEEVPGLILRLRSGGARLSSGRLRTQGQPRRLHPQRRLPLPLALAHRHAGSSFLTYPQFYRARPAAAMKSGTFTTGC